MKAKPRQEHRARRQRRRQSTRSSKPSPSRLTLGLIEWRSARIEAEREGDGPGCHEETRAATRGVSGTDTDEGDGGRGVAGGGGAAGGVLAFVLVGDCRLRAGGCAREGDQPSKLSREPSAAARPGMCAAADWPWLRMGAAGDWPGMFSRSRSDRAALSAASASARLPPHVPTPPPSMPLRETPPPIEMVALLP